VAHPGNHRRLGSLLSRIRFVLPTGPLPTGPLSPELADFLGFRVRSLSRLLTEPKGSSMTQSTNDQQLTENRRKEIFLALVDAQDHEIDVAQSRRLIVQRFAVSESQVRQIEREGMENQWPPLE
jgi:hypothetical protein